MKRFGWSISRYLLQAVLPYFVFTWLLLSVILFVQQASRFSDIFFSVNLPASLIWQLTFALAPNVIAFTCPMAVLIGVIIGLARMQGDSELTAIRGAGVGNFQIAVPVIVLGALLSIFALFINLKGVPLAAQIVRKVAVQSAVKKLESPIEPGVFNTEINGFTIYVKNVDFDKGTWRNIFIYTEDSQTKEVRLITSKNGRIDFNDENNELVLENAIITTLPGQTDKSAEKEKNKYVSESVGNIRFAINTKRSELLEKINSGEITAEEMGLSDLAEFARSKQGKERIEAEVLWQRRVVLSITPLLFALLGTALNLRFNRGGRGFGVFLALISLVAYYLLALFGEQMARTKKMSPVAGSLLPVAASCVAIGWLFLSSRVLSSVPLGGFKRKFNFGFSKLISFKKPLKTGKSFFVSWLYGILDFDLISSLIKYFLLTLGFLSAIYIIFTAFELWKFAGTIDNGFILLIEYLIFLIPFIYIQLAPSAIMIAILATYVIKSRNNEIVTWTAAGQSIYRLLFPCYLLMIGLGIFNWQVQERILPETNRVQDELRSQMRNRGISAKKEGKYWVATDERIYSFQIEENKIKEKPSTALQTVKNLSVYDFSPSESRLQSVYQIPEAVWDNDRITFKTDAVKNNLINGQITKETVSNGELVEKQNPLRELTKKPNHLNASTIIEQMENTESETERRSFAVALEKKYTTGVLPFIITLFTAPFALSLSRRGKVATVGYAVAVWLVFMGVTSYFEQFGLSGYLAPAMAVWSPLFLFTIFGIFMMSKLKT